MKIFLLEDDPIYMDIIRSALKELKHEIVIWEQIDGAKEKIEKGGFDFLVIDIILPKKRDEPGDEIRDGGIRILESLKKSMIPPTVFVSISGYEENRDRIMNLELNHQIPPLIKQLIKPYFRKPYNINEFLETVKELAKYINGQQEQS